MSEPTVNPFTPPAATLDAPPLPDANVTLADRGTRFAAVFLDGLTALPAAVLAWITVFLLGADKTGNAPVPAAAIALGASAGLYILGLGIYQLYLLSTRGQSLGKRWMGIKIVLLSGAAPGFTHAVLLRVFVNGLISGVPYLGGIYGLVDVLLIFREDRRCIHDMLAGTRVVKA
jgi:uncharacterized RDD family membrane protein YckC